MKSKERPLAGPTLLTRDTNIAAKGACILLAAALVVTMGAIGVKHLYLSTKSPEFQQLYNMEQMSDKKVSDTALTKDILSVANEVGVNEVNFWLGPTPGNDTGCLLLAIPMTEEQQHAEMTYTKVSYEFDNDEMEFKEVREQEKSCGADYLRLSIAELMSDYIAGTGDDSINFQVTSNDTGIIAMLGTETGKYITNFSYVMENYGDESVTAQFELLKDSFDQPGTTV